MKELELEARSVLETVCENPTFHYTTDWRMVAYAAIVSELVDIKSPVPVSVHPENGSFYDNLDVVLSNDKTSEQCVASLMAAMRAEIDGFVDFIEQADQTRLAGVLELSICIVDVARREGAKYNPLIKEAQSFVNDLKVIAEDWGKRPEVSQQECVNGAVGDVLKLIEGDRQTTGYFMVSRANPIQRHLIAPGSQDISLALSELFENINS